MKKIQQTFILHRQNWIGSVQSSFVELEADTIDEGQLNICMVEVGKLRGGQKLVWPIQLNPLFFL